MKPSKLAQLFTNQFLQGGNFELAGATSTEASRAAAGLDVVAADKEAFANLSVQAVGYAEGGETEEFVPAVYVYVTRGTKRALKDLPETVENIPLIVDSVGKIIVKPKATLSNRGHIFARNGRVACGSSCAPSGKDYSGTLGALVHKNGDPSCLYALSNNMIAIDRVLAAFGGLTLVGKHGV